MSKPVTLKEASQRLQYKNATIVRAMLNDKRSNTWVKKYFWKLGRNWITDEKTLKKAIKYRSKLLD